MKWYTNVAATDYTLQISTNNTFSSLVFNQGGLTNTNQVIAGLNDATLYYWRVKAVNKYGSSPWSSVWSFKTSPILSPGSPCPGVPTVTYGGKTYNTVQIGSQCWLKENLNIGEMINASSKQKNNNIVEKYCYNNNSLNCEKYGGLYQWTEAVQYINGVSDSAYVPLPFFEKKQGICPAGWHIPIKEEFDSLLTKVKNDANSLLAVGEGQGTNLSGFSALLAGTKIDGNFSDPAKYFWSDRQVYWFGAHSLFLDDAHVSIQGQMKTSGFSVRCIKD